MLLLNLQGWKPRKFLESRFRDFLSHNEKLKWGMLAFCETKWDEAELRFDMFRSISVVLLSQEGCVWARCEGWGGGDVGSAFVLTLASYLVRRTDHGGCAS